MNARVEIHGGPFLALAAALLAAGCSSGTDGSADASSGGPRDWVVVSYHLPQGDPALTANLHTELEVQRALRRTGAGVIDGNEVGQGRYDLYLVGEDGQEIWDVVEPVLAGAPVAWFRVELRDGLNDRDPEVIRP